MHERRTRARRSWYPRNIAISPDTTYDAVTQRIWAASRGGTVAVPDDGPP